MNENQRMMQRRSQKAADIKQRERIYAIWYRGDRQLRLVLTVLGGRPVLDLRIGDERGPRWIPSQKGVLIELGEIDILISSLRKASADVKRYGLDKQTDEGGHRLSRPKRWARV